jgi:hypothetical protein
MGKPVNHERHDREDKGDSNTMLTKERPSRVCRRPCSGEMLNISTWAGVSSRAIRPGRQTDRRLDQAPGNLNYTKGLWWAPTVLVPERQPLVAMAGHGAKNLFVHITLRETRSLPRLGYGLATLGIRGGSSASRYIGCPELSFKFLM